MSNKNCAATKNRLLLNLSIWRDSH